MAYYIYSRGVSNGVTLNYDSMYIFSGGVANSTTVNYAGNMYIESGGTANSTTVNSGGDMYIGIGGVANSTTVNSGGYMYISYGGVANSTTINSGGYMYISNGGTATNINWTPCVGHVNAEDDAYVTYASTYSGVYFGSNNQLLSSAPTMYNKIVSGLMYVMSGGVANRTTVNSGSVYISSGGTANSTTVNSGSMYISSGGEANRTTVNSGGWMNISFGGVANSTTVNSCGEMFIHRGALAVNIVENGGWVDVEDGAFVTFASHTISDLIIGNDCRMTVHGNTIANSTIVYDHGNMSIYSGGVANNTTLNIGNMDILSGGTANSTTVNYDGRLRVFSGGVANSTTVNSGGGMDIYSGGVHRGTLQIVSETMFWADSGSVIDFTVADRTAADGYLINDLTLIKGAPTYTITVSAAQKFGTYKLAQGAADFSGTISIGDETTNYGSITVNGADFIYKGVVYSLDLVNGDLTLLVEDKNTVIVYSSGTVVSKAAEINGAILCEGKNNAMYISNGGEVNRTTVNSGGEIIIESGGVANSTTVNSDGFMIISSGGEANSTTINTWGHMYISSGGVANSTTINAWGDMYIYAGGSANRTTISAGGSMNIVSGVVANSTTVNSGGYMLISSGGVANSTTINDWGSMAITSDSEANRTTINAWGDMYINSGGSANSTTINAWGDMFIRAGGSANSTIMSSGYMYISSSGIHRGSLQIESGAVVSAYSGSVIDFTVADRTAADGYLINDLTLIKGAPTYTITVSATQALGTYKLAQGAADFSGTISIGDETTNYGSITVNGADFTYNAITYSLDLVNGDLTLLVEDKNTVIVYSSGTVVSKATEINGAKLYIGSMFISSGGVANSTTVNYGGRMYISSGGVANSTTVNSGGCVHVSSGGKLLNATISAGHRGDSIVVSYGGSASDISALNGGDLVIRGGTLFDAIISQGTGQDKSDLYVSGGFVKGVYVADDSWIMLSHGVVENAVIASGGSICISSGGVANSTTVNSNGNMYIRSGGVANSTTVNSGGRMNIYNGGSAIEVKENGGYVDVENGANVTFAFNTITGIVLSGGSMTVHKNTVANSTTVNYGGRMEINSGGVANSTTMSGGDMYINSGGVANSTTMSGGGMYINSCGVANITTVNSYGDMYINSGGVANSTTVNSGGSMYISSGGVANSTTVNSGGGMIISSGGVANSTTVSSGGDIYISSGGSAIEVKENGGYVYVANGANVTFAFNTITGILLSGGVMTVHKNTVANNTTVNSYGRMYISSGGVANRTTMSGGRMFISSGGVANSTTVNYGYMSISSGGTATNLTAYSGAYLEITVAPNTYIQGTSGGSAFEMKDASISNYSVMSSGYMHIYSGGVANSTTVNYQGSMSISSGGVANSTTVNASGYMSISSGGVANSTTVNSGGRMDINSGGVANSTTVNYGGGMAIDSGGVANSTTVNNGGDMHIFNGGTANSTTVNPHGSMFIYNGGSAIEVKENGGYVDVGNGANVTFAFNTITGIVLSHGGMTVHKNTVANNTTVNFYGYMSISSGGVANSTTVNYQGSMSISSGGVANSTTVNYGGYMYIFSGGVANSTTVNRYGSMTISSGGVASSTTVNSGGNMFISSGGVHRGSLQIESGAYVYAYGGGKIDFTVAERTASDGYLINDLSLISGTPTYTITVSATQANGTYKLAQGAANFSRTISIGDGTTNYGSITVNGDDFVYNGVTYSLDKADGNLTLTIAKPSVVSNLKGDVNGVSWNGGGNAFTVTYSTDNFATELQVNTTTKAVDTYGMPAGSYQWKVAADGEEYKGNNIVSDNTTAAQKLISDADGNMDLFFARSSGTWNSEYFAQRSGTQKLVALEGKNRIQDVFMGSTDANVLVLTDDANGDALFIDDMYSALGNQARLSQIDEIRAGAGNDIIDLTSNKYAFAGDKLTIFGGAGDDTIWANSGNDVLIGGAGNDSLFGGGGNDTFIFGDNWGNDTVEQLSGGSVTLHFENGSLANWNAATGVYSDGVNSVTVTGTSDITLKFGEDASLPAGVFTDAVNEKIFEDKNKGMIA